MAKQNFTTEQIIIKLSEIEVLSSQGKTIAEAKPIYRWRKVRRNEYL